MNLIFSRRSKPDAVLGDREFVRTDLEFGSLDEKHPLILCGVEAARVLRESQLKGVDLYEFITERERDAMKKREAGT
jgi:hypothetical protein